MTDKREQSVCISRQWAMPSAWTFTILPIKNLLKKYVLPWEFWCDPFAGENSPADVRNDFNGKHEFCMDALDFLKTRRAGEFDGVLLDPPYSLRQVSEHYKKHGRTITGWHTSAGHTAALKNECARIIRHGGIAICFGWTSGGLGKSRGFVMVEILLVPHGGSKNDTIVTVEIKT